MKALQKILGAKLVSLGPYESSKWPRFFHVLSSFPRRDDGGSKLRETSSFFKAKTMGDMKILMACVRHKINQIM